MTTLEMLIDATIERRDARMRRLETRLPLWTPQQTEAKLARAQRELRRAMRRGDVVGYLRQRNDRDKARARSMA